MSSSQKLTMTAFILMILTSVFGVTNIGLGFYRMGYAAIPMFILGGLLFFLPFVFMMVEFGGHYGTEGGIFSWMEKSVSRKFAFVGVMMWYASYVIWMFSKTTNLWIPLSFAIFGENILNTIPAYWIALGGIAVMLIITLIISRGARFLSRLASVGGWFVIILNVILIGGGLFLFVVNGFSLAEPLTGGSFTGSPNPNYDPTSVGSWVPFLGFVVFAVFAYGGTEALAGAGDDLEDPSQLKKGLLIATIFIIVAYVVGFLAIGAISSWNDAFAELHASGNISSLDALFLIMGEFGSQLGVILGGNGETLANVFMSFAGIGMFITYLGALIALSYAPLKQLIDGAPESFPDSFSQENERGIKTRALWTQFFIVTAILLFYAVVSFIDASAGATLFELTVTMTNVGMTLPYLFLIFAWFIFRMKEDPSNPMIKSKAIAVILFLISFSIVLFGNVFTIADVAMNADPIYLIMTIGGPIIFGLLGLIIAIVTD